MLHRRAASPAPAAAAYMLVNLAAVDRAEGDLDRARQLTEESLARFRHLEDRHGRGVRPQRARQHRPLRRRLRARAGAARPEPGAAPADRRPPRQRDDARLPGDAARPLRRRRRRPRLGRAEPALVRRERRPGRPRRRRVQPRRGGAVRRGSRRRPRAPGSGGGGARAASSRATTWVGRSPPLPRCAPRTTSRPRPASGSTGRPSTSSCSSGDAGLAYCRELERG